MRKWKCEEKTQINNNNNLERRRAKNFEKDKKLPTYQLWKDFIKESNTIKNI